MGSGASPPEGTTVVGRAPGDRPLVWIGFPLLAAAAGWLLKAAVEWVASLQFRLFHGPFKLVASIPEPQATLGSLAVGLVAGLALAYLAERDYVTVTVGRRQVSVARGGSSRDLPRASIGAVFLDGDHLVLLGHATEELARQGGDLPEAKRLQSAFLSHAYPWRDNGDPYKDEYQPWVEDIPGPPPGAGALLKARARALAKDDKDDAAELRAELAKLGIVVRDRNKRQYWRHIQGWSGR